MQNNFALLRCLTVLTCFAPLRAEEDRAPPIPAAPIAMIGDSITRQGNWQKILGREDVTNWGFPGYTTGQLEWTFKDLIRLQPGLKVVFLSGGTNDLLLGIPLERIYRNQVNAVAYWRDRGVVPVLQSVLLQRGDASANASIQELNTRLQAYCAKEKIDYVDVNAVLAKDGELRAELTQEGTHLLPEAYPLWAELVQKTLKKLGY